MDRISTASAYGAILTSLMQAEINQSNAGAQLSSTEKATSLEGYGASAETLGAMQAASTQVTGYLDNTQTVAAKLSMQNTALGEVATSAGGAVQAITNALATGNGASLMQSLQNAFDGAVGGLNSTFNGEYLFAGGQVTTPPVSASSLGDLTSGPPLSSFFHNDQRQISSQIDQNTSINSGFRADQVGTPLFAAFQAVEAYAQGPNGPFSGTLTTAQQTFLTQQLAGFKTVQTSLNEVVAQNGLMQGQVTNAQSDLGQRQTMLQGLIGGATAADLAQASTNLQQAQLSVQAAGQVFQTLKASSLLNFLSSSASVG
ncbi:MAG TPA: flagellin [Caulobacteraceae bacterium]|nr:flagellin [Caulobacteraceae bacterium]